MNTEVVKCYYKATHTTPAKIINSMHKFWKEKYPNSPHREQRISDQRRVIFKRADNVENINIRGNWITNQEITAIKDESFYFTTEIIF